MTPPPSRRGTYLGLLLSLAVSTGSASASDRSFDQDVVRGIEVSRTLTGGIVVVHGTKSPIFSVFRLVSPDRIVVDLEGADVSRTKASVPRGIPGLLGVSAVQLQQGASRVGRVILLAAADVRYQVQTKGTDVLIALTPAVRSNDANGSAALGGPDMAMKPASSSEDLHLVDSIEDRANPVTPGHRVLSVTAQEWRGQARFSVRTDGPVGTFVVWRLRDPSRVAIDFDGFRARHARVLGAERLASVRFGIGTQGARVVFDLKTAEVPEVHATRGPSGLVIVLGPPVAVPVATREFHRDVPAVKEPLRAVLKGLRIGGDSLGETVVIDLPVGMSVALPQVTEVGDGRFQLSLAGTLVPPRLQRTLDASAFGGPIATVSSYNVGAGQGRILVVAASGSSQRLRRDGTRMTWSFSPAPPQVTSQASPAISSKDVASSVGLAVQESVGQAAGFTTVAGEAAATSPRKPRYTGRRISMEFKDIDIQNLLRLFAEISHRNIVVSDDVKGKVTIALRNVPWDQAFELILKTHGLGKEEVGNIIRIAPEAELEKERKAELEAQRARQQLAPLKVRLIPVNYALAADVADKIKDVLSDRGIVTVDQRTNVLIVKDVVDNLAKAEGMVRNLDTQTPQVLIESRIVEAATTFAREIGIQWGGNGGFSPSTANTTGLVFPSLATAAGAAGDSPNAGTGAVPNFAVNLPAAIGPGSGGGLGFIFGSAGGAFNLNLRLSALENNGVVKTVSAPKVATLDNQEAAISQGLSIPFAQVSAAGVQTAFIEARLELKVTPHVTADGSILMKISATNNQPNAGITGANGQPSISRKEAKTQMLVKDGDTTVIGGIYTRATGMAINEVPFFGKIPILGWLFKHRADSDNRTELLIFITPRILNRQQVVSAGVGG